MHKEFFVAFVIFLVGIAIFQSVSCNKVEVIKETVSTVKAQSVSKYGFDVGSFLFEEIAVKPNQFLGDILGQYDVSSRIISELAQKAKDIYSVRMIQAGKNLTFIKKDSCSSPFCFVYEPNPFSYVVYQFDDSTSVNRKYNDFEVCIETAIGSVESTLWDAMIKNGLNASIIDKMEDALASSVDFYHTQKGDQFKLVFERKYINDKPVSIGKILGAYYKNSQGNHYSIFYENGEYKGFYDQEGRAATSSFLRSPVKYSRISSRFNKNRFHPILKRRKAHLGTDYAAAYGTPIRSVADGVVLKKGYTKGNGKYVKLKHNKIYQTQYLHMQKFAKGIRPGVRVKQGQTIGYVGSTGLATGPHVCFRFWKNGRQINHLREIFPPAKPMESTELPLFYDVRDDIVVQLDGLFFPSEQFASINP